MTNSSTKTLMERVGGFAQKKPTPVKRGGASYDATQQFCKNEIERYVEMYRQLKVEDQTARLIRDMIDVLLRRYHGYSIKENIGAHYYETGLPHGTKIFDNLAMMVERLLHADDIVPETVEMARAALQKKK